MAPQNNHTSKMEHLLTSYILHPYPYHFICSYRNMWRYPGNATITKHYPSRGTKSRRDEKQIMTNKCHIWHHRCTNKGELQRRTQLETALELEFMLKYVGCVFTLSNICASALFLQTCIFDKRRHRSACPSLSSLPEDTFGSWLPTECPVKTD